MGEKNTSVVRLTIVRPLNLQNSLKYKEQNTCMSNSKVTRVPLEKTPEVLKRRTSGSKSLWTIINCSSFNFITGEAATVSCLWLGASMAGKIRRPNVLWMLIFIPFSPICQWGSSPRISGCGGWGGGGEGGRKWVLKGSDEPKSALVLS